MDSESDEEIVEIQRYQGYDDTPIVFDIESLDWNTAKELVYKMLQPNRGWPEDCRKLIQIFGRFPSMLYDTSMLSSTPRSVLWCFLSTFMQHRRSGSPDPEVEEAGNYTYPEEVQQLIIDILSNLPPSELSLLLATPATGDGTLMIHAACRLGGDRLVNFLLAKQDPDLMTRVDAKQYLPIDFGITNTDLSEETMIKLVRASPTGVNSTILVKAIKTRCPLRVLHTIVTVWPNNVTHLKLSILDESISKNQAQALTDILIPKLKTLNMDVYWTIPAFQLFLEKLEKNQSIWKIEHLSLPVLLSPRVSETTRNDVLGAFRNLIRNNTTLKEIRGLKSNIGGPTLVQAWLGSINDGLVGGVNDDNNSNTTLKHLEITMNNIILTLHRDNDDDFDNDSDSDHEQQPHATQEQVKNPQQQQQQQQKTALRKSTIAMNASISCPRSLCDMGILDFVRRCFPGISLKFDTVRLMTYGDAGRDQDATKDILSLLHNNQHTKQIGCLRYKLDLTTVCEALRSDTTLHTFQTDVIPSMHQLELCLRMLQVDNTTLMSFHAMSQSDARIQYYLDLNRLGRTKARKSNQLTHLVDALLDVGMDPKLHRPKKTHQSRVLGILYGLLREKPGNWCSYNSHHHQQHDAATTSHNPSRSRSCKRKTPPL